MARRTPDFFAAQRAARLRTAWLLACFGVALVVLVGLFYLGAALPLLVSREGTRLFHAELLGFVAVGVLGTTAAGCAYHLAQLARGGAAAVVEGVGGTRVDAGAAGLQERRLVDVVEEMAIASGVPVPQVFVLRAETGINALAAGDVARGAVVAVTAGALEQLTRDELQAVVAHEFGHLLNGDSILNARLMGLLGGLSIVDLFGREALRVATAGGRGDWRLGVVLLPSGIVLAVAGWAGLLCGQAVRCAVSREREYLADAAAAQFTRNPGALASALVKIRDRGSALRQARAVEASHFFFANALEGVFARWLQTHPPIDERIRRLDPAADVRVRDEATRTSTATGSGAAILATIGAPRSEHLARAAEILASLPPDVATAARAPEAAPALLLALAEGRSGLTPEQRLCVADLAIAALDGVSGERLDALAQALDLAARADAHVTVFEWMLQRLVRHRLERSRAGQHVPRARFGAVAQLEVECLQLLSLIAWSGSRDAAQARAALEAGVRALGTGERWTVLPREKLGAEVADAALRQLASASLEVKRRVLRAAAAAALADARVTGPEAELLRVVSASLDCPMPPVLPGALFPDSVDYRKWRTAIPK